VAPNTEEAAQEESWQTIMKLVRTQRVLVRPHRTANTAARDAKALATPLNSIAIAVMQRVAVTSKSRKLSLEISSVN
jgi:hypothetical protein